MAIYKPPRSWKSPCATNKTLCRCRSSYSARTPRPLGGRNRLTTHKQPRQSIPLKYDGHQATTLTAKGDDELAKAILKIARYCEVPIYENAELVKLLARMELGDSIPEALYRTV